VAEGRRGHTVAHGDLAGDEHQRDGLVVALPEVFDLWADGLDLVVFEEFGAGAAALHESDPAKRTALLKDPAYRARFKKEWRSVFSPKAFHRDLSLARVES